MHILEPCCIRRQLLNLRDSIENGGRTQFQGYGDLSITELLPALLARYTETELMIVAPTMPDQATEVITRWMRQQWPHANGVDKLNVVRQLTIITDLSPAKSPVMSDWLKDNPFAGGMIASVKEIFGSDVSNCEYLINGGVIYAKDNQVTHELFRRWNKNWTYSCFEKGNSQDQPALWQSDHEMGNVIKLLPDVYNSQVAMSLQYFADAAIVHFLHMNFIPDQSYSPYLSLKIYKDIKVAGTLTTEIKNMIINCKSSFMPMTMPVGKDQLLFLFTDMGKTYVQIYKEGGIASWLMLKSYGWLKRIHKHTCKNK